MPVNLKLEVNKNLYVRDPGQTNLGKKIISGSIFLISESGINDFNFKKLASYINSNEPSIYRYFESKKQLLFYLINWYWSWVEYRIYYQIKTEEPVEKLKVVIKALSESVRYDTDFPHIDEAALAHIVIRESPTSYITINIPKEEKTIIFESYHSLCSRISEIIKEVNPEYNNPRALTISMIRMTHEQIFFSKYYPEFTELKSKDDEYPEISDFVETTIFSILNKEQ